MPKIEAWCPWCKRWIYPIKHIGPGLFCPNTSCRGQLGIKENAVYAARPFVGAPTPINVQAEANQPEMVYA